MDMDFSSYLLSQSSAGPEAKPAAPAPTTPPSEHQSPMKLNFQEALLQTMFETPHQYSQISSPSKQMGTASYADTSAPVLSSPSSTARVLSFGNTRTAPTNNFDNKLKVLYSSNRFESTNPSNSVRMIDTSAQKVLDAPDFVDDYYLNLLDWNSSNVLAVALANSVYLWNASSGKITQLFTTSESVNIITSLAWADNIHLAIGTTYSDVYLWDCSTNQQQRRLRGHSARVSALAWHSHILSTAGRDTAIMNNDVRVANHCVSTFQGHSQEVCGLKWSPNGSQLASGGNDNLLNVWELASSARPTHSFTQHTAAVKAVAWCPWQQNLLASGGGTADRSIKFWNTSSGTCLNTIDTGSQVCSILWSKTSKELVSSHGFTKNQLCVWKYPSMTKMADLTGHTSRVLHMAMSPDGTTVVSAAGDETLRFWKVFDAPHSTATASSPLSPTQRRARRVTAELSPKSVLIR